MRSITALLLLFFSISAASQAKLTFTKSHGLLLVSVKVNGTAAVMLFDTGASHTIISIPLSGVAARAAELRSSANGTTGQAFNTVADITLDSEVLHKEPCLAANVDSVSRDLGVRVDGILGIDVTGRFKTISIDMKTHTITLAH